MSQDPEQHVHVPLVPENPPENPPENQSIIIKFKHLDSPKFQHAMNDFPSQLQGPLDIPLKTFTGAVTEHYRSKPLASVANFISVNPDPFQQLFQHRIVKSIPSLNGDTTEQTKKRDEIVQIIFDEYHDIPTFISQLRDQKYTDKEIGSLLRKIYPEHFHDKINKELSSPELLPSAPSFPEITFHSTINQMFTDKTKDIILPTFNQLAPILKGQFQHILHFYNSSNVVNLVSSLSTLVKSGDLDKKTYDANKDKKTYDSLLTEIDAHLQNYPMYIDEFRSTSIDPAPNDYWRVSGRSVTHDSVQANQEERTPKPTGINIPYFQSIAPLSPQTIFSTPQQLILFFALLRSCWSRNLGSIEASEAVTKYCNQLASLLEVDPSKLLHVLETSFHLVFLTTEFTTMKLTTIVSSAGTGKSHLHMILYIICVQLLLPVCLVFDHGVKNRYDLKVVFNFQPQAPQSFFSSKSMSQNVLTLSSPQTIFLQEWKDEKFDLAVTSYAETSSKWVEQFHLNPTWTKHQPFGLLLSSANSRITHELKKGNSDYILQFKDIGIFPYVFSPHQFNFLLGMTQLALARNIGINTTIKQLKETNKTRQVSAFSALLKVPESTPTETSYITSLINHPDSFEVIRRIAFSSQIFDHSDDLLKKTSSVTPATTQPNTTATPPNPASPIVSICYLQPLKSQPIQFQHFPTTTLSPTSIQFLDSHWYNLALWYHFGQPSIRLFILFASHQLPPPPSTPSFSFSFTQQQSLYRFKHFQPAIYRSQISIYPSVPDVHNISDIISLERSRLSTNIAFEWFLCNSYSTYSNHFTIFFPHKDFQQYPISKVKSYQHFSGLPINHSHIYEDCTEKLAQMKLKLLQSEKTTTQLDAFHNLLRIDIESLTSSNSTSKISTVIYFPPAGYPAIDMIVFNVETKKVLGVQLGASRNSTDRHDIKSMPPALAGIFEFALSSGESTIPYSYCTNMNAHMPPQIAVPYAAFGQPTIHQHSGNQVIPILTAKTIAAARERKQISQLQRSVVEQLLVVKAKQLQQDFPVDDRFYDFCNTGGMIMQHAKPAFLTLFQEFDPTCPQPFFSALKLPALQHLYHQVVSSEKK